MINDVISAISTPYGKGGIAVIRVSGKGSIEICEKICFPFKKGSTLSNYDANTAIYCRLIDNDEPIDEVVATIFKAPHSYTGEDTVEISCHGGILVTQRVLEAVLGSGARMAEPGEYTKRAFINGKLSLSQAEAVIGVINSENTAQLKLYSSHVSGKLKNEINDIRKELLKIVSSIYAFIDFPDEDMTDIPVDKLLEDLKVIRDRLTKLKNSYRAGQAITEGIKTVIAGKPNVGKSSLLNMLLGRNRAIVTDIAGTTRDTIEESACVGGVTLRLCDTAGLHESNDTVEKIGVEISKEKLASSDLILALFDGSNELDENDTEFINYLSELSCEKIVIINKSDLGCKIDVEMLKTISQNIISISCNNNEGKDELEKIISNMFISGEIEENNAIVANARQFNSISQTLSSIEQAIESLNSYTQDIAGMDIENALSSLSLVDGRSVSEDIVNEIFHSFCVGK